MGIKFPEKIIPMTPYPFDNKLLFIYMQQVCCFGLSIKSSVIPDLIVK